jgi:hypothetical protein
MMLRNVILAIFVLLCLCAAAAAAAGRMPWGPAIMLGIVAAIITFERQRYQARATAGPRANMSPTPERFIDPETGRRVQVWTNAGGERHYVEEPQAES